MKKLTYLFIFSLIIILSGCDDKEGLMGYTNTTNVDGMEENYKTIEIEGCEYIMYDAGSGYKSNGFLAHKGNCPNPIHKCN